MINPCVHSTLEFEEERPIQITTRVFLNKDSAEKEWLNRSRAGAEAGFCKGPTWGKCHLDKVGP